MQSMPTDHLLVEECLLEILFMPFPNPYAITLHKDVCQVSPEGFICVCFAHCCRAFVWWTFQTHMTQRSFGTQSAWSFYLVLRLVAKWAPMTRMEKGTKWYKPNPVIQRRMSSFHLCFLQKSQVNI